MSTVLVVAAHPDDEVLGCGGAMARHAADGDQVRVVVATRGVAELYSAEEVEIGRRELRAAGAVLGVGEAEFLDFPAPRLDTVPQHEIADALRRVLQRVRPDTVYLPHRGDMHLDHRLLFDAVLVAARPTAGCSVRTLLCYETLSETDWGPPFAEFAFVPNYFVDISQHLQHKLDAMACYQSQLKPAPSPRSLEAIEHLARLRGATVGLAAAEAFMLVRHIA